MEQSRWAKYLEAWKAVKDLPYEQRWTALEPFGLSYAEKCGVQVGEFVDFVEGNSGEYRVAYSLETREIVQDCRPWQMLV